MPRLFSSRDFGGWIGFRIIWGVDELKSCTISDDSVDGNINRAPQISRKWGSHECHYSINIWNWKWLDNTVILAVCMKWWHLLTRFSHFHWDHLSLSALFFVSSFRLGVWLAAQQPQRRRKKRHTLILMAHKNDFFPFTQWTNRLNFQIDNMLWRMEMKMKMATTQIVQHNNTCSTRKVQIAQVFICCFFFSFIKIEWPQTHIHVLLFLCSVYKTKRQKTL